MKNLALFSILATSLVFASCRRKCIECECTDINGDVSTKENCAYGKEGIENQDTWKELERANGCITLECDG